MCVCVRACMRACVRACVCVRVRVCVRACVCVVSVIVKRPVLPPKVWYMGALEILFIILLLLCPKGSRFRWDC